MTLQHEGNERQHPLRKTCSRCKGWGYLADPDCHHSGNCPCGSVPCPECEEQGWVAVTCDHCGKDATQVDAYTKQPLCDEGRMNNSAAPASGGGGGR